MLADSYFKYDSQIPLDQLSSDMTETADKVSGGGDMSEEDDIAPNDCEVNDSDDSRISGDVDCDGGNLEAENRYFAFNVHSSEDLHAVDAESSETSFKIEPDMKLKIFNALKLSDATLFIASPKLQCFIGYALVIKSKVLIGSPGEIAKEISTADNVLPIRWGKMCCLPFKDTSKIMNAFNSEKPVSQFQDGQVYSIGQT
jgi:YT521-B-like domain